MAKKKKRSTKKPVLKKAKRKVVKKKTKAPPHFTREDQLEVAATLLARRVNRDAIRRIISLKLYGGDTKAHPLKVIPEHDLDQLLKDANARALDVYRRSLDDSKTQAIGTYEEILRDPESKPNDRLQAQKRIDELIGHDYKLRSDADVTDEDRAVRILVALEQARGTVPAKK